MCEGRVGGRGGGAGTPHAAGAVMRMCPECSWPHGLVARMASQPDVRCRRGCGISAVPCHALMRARAHEGGEGGKESGMAQARPSPAQPSHTARPYGVRSWSAVVRQKGLWSGSAPSSVLLYLAAEEDKRVGT